MTARYVGFYWTLPIKWAGFRRLPPGNVEAAAAKSRTIRYQMHSVRQWVAENGGRLVEELVFMELSPDRGTDAIRGELDKVRELCVPNRAELIYVNFAEAFNWRRHPHLRSYIDEHGIPCMALPPEPITIKGKWFDPIEHFENSRRKHQEKIVSLRETSDRELLLTAEEHYAMGGSYETISDELNERGIARVTGRPWTAEIVRKTLKRRGVSLSEI